MKKAGEAVDEELLWEEEDDQVDDAVIPDNEETVGKSEARASVRPKILDDPSAQVSALSTAIHLLFAVCSNSLQTPPTR